MTETIEQQLKQLVKLHIQLLEERHRPEYWESCVQLRCQESRTLLQAILSEHPIEGINVA